MALLRKPTDLCSTQALQSTVDHVARMHFHVQHVCDKRSGQVKLQTKPQNPKPRSYPDLTPKITPMGTLPEP